MFLGFLIACLTMNMVTASGRLGCQDEHILLTNTSGHLRPMFSPYGPPITCMKYFFAPHGRYICIQPIGSSVLYNMNVFDVGENQTSVLIASLLDISSSRVGDPPGICSESNTMVVEFVVAGQLSVSYFTQAAATDNQPSCGGTFVEPSGSCSSPNYPSSYNKNQACLYNISVPGVRSVCLDINHVDMHNPSQLIIELTELVGSDSTGTNVTRNPIRSKGTLCSKNNKMVVYLLSGSGNISTHQGFRATYRSLL
ncbi:CUBN-like protein [Mya arenaria]|uniref:CUBN-like protein n=1 Tax=Mya arenaria TaxID=6604 RepID=A0ABY7FQ14_MYAAR|nr:CUBN-like protein [Mya arenaria]